MTPSPPEPHLPSYLSLACTVNGYSTTTNYDPIRLARSRDASPHRIDPDLTPNKVTYSVQNNLLSPPNLVPLPTKVKPKSEMGENTLTQHHHQEFYSSTKTMSFMSKESHFTSNLFSTKDTIDGCLENGHHTIHNKCVNFESKNITSINGQNKCTSETSIRQEFSNGNETKSFIQQRVERLYGPGALAQGFFVSKRQKNRLSESEDKNTSLDSEKHSKSMTDKLLEDDLEPSMKQSTSSPTLPVLRHLRPEFRAQLPIISPRKGVESLMQKSVTVPKLKDEINVNGHCNGEEEIKISALKDISNGHTELIIKEKSGEKDGHYFLRILEEQTKRLLQLASRVESDISTPDLSEEVIGKLRSTAGKAKLLVSQKMQQFKGLCTNNINQSVGEAFPTTNEDLQGFWDMVMLQVDQVDALFEEINVLRKNNWQEVVKVENKVNTNGTAKPKKAVSRPRPTSAANEEARKQREAQRKKMIEERRKAMKAQQSKPRESIEIFVPESS